MQCRRLAARLATYLLVVTIISSSSYAQEHEDARDPARPADGAPDGVFWPTQKMLEGFFNRVVEDMTRDYGLDLDQRERTLALLKERISDFLNRNRVEIQALLARYFEALVDDEAPDPEDVALWAQRVLPLIEDFRESVDGMSDEMHEFLTDDQIAVLEGNRAAFHAGVDFATNRMQVWADGGYDPQTEWYRNSEARQAERQRRAAVRAEMAAQRQAAIDRVRAEQGLAAAAEAAAAPAASRAPPPSTTQPAGDEWEHYVENFIRKYGLNEDQKQQAHRFLRQQQAERDRYLKRREREMQRLLEQWRIAGSAEQVARAEADYARFTRPIDELFERLKTKLEQIPTRAQRRAAEGAASGARGTQ
jgi:hypothetical protein